MQEPNLKGLIAATFTPTTAEREFAPDAVPSYVEFLLQRGVQGLFVCGSSGEFASFTVEERCAIAEAFLHAVDGRVPVLVHVGHNCLADARRLATHAATLGTAGIAFSPPNFFKPACLDAAVECCAHIANAVPDTPCFYYHIPDRTGVSFDMKRFLAVAVDEIPAFAGVKYTHQALDEYLLCRQTFPDTNMVFGADEMLLCALAAGATCAIGTTYNHLAPLYTRLWSAFREGDLETARQCQCRSVRFIRTLKTYGGLAAMKTAMTLFGMDCGPPRLPLRPLSEAKRAALQQSLRHQECTGF